MHLLSKCGSACTVFLAVLKSWSSSGMIFWHDFIRNKRISFSPAVYSKQFLWLKVRSSLSSSFISSSYERSYLSYASLHSVKMRVSTCLSFLIESGGKSLALNPLVGSSSSESESSPLLYF